MDSRPPLSQRQRDTLAFIERFIATHGYPPSLREMAEALGIRSTNGVADHVRALEKKGYLERTESRSRALRVGDHGQLLERALAAEERADVWERRAREAGWSESEAA